MRQDTRTHITSEKNLHLSVDIYFVKKADMAVTKADPTANGRLVVGFAPTNAGGTLTAIL